MGESGLTLIVFSLGLVAHVAALPDGAPPDVCMSMIPGHGVEPQKSEAPYVLKTDVLSGGQLMITIKPKKSEDMFRGFLLQIRDKDGKPFGEFKPEIESKLMDCPPGHNNSITHSDADTQKFQMKITWQCPLMVDGEKFKGEAYAIATIVKEKNEFWVGVKSDPFYINMP